MNKTNCVGYNDCRKYSEEEDLNCQDCDHFQPTDCYEDYGGKKPFFGYVVKRRDVK